MSTWTRSLAEAGSTAAEPVLSMRNVVITADTDTSTTALVDGVDLAVSAGERVGLVGESGSGKSLTCLAAIGLVASSLRVSGEIRLAGEDLATMPSRRQRHVRGTTAAMIFQEPMSSLNPVLTIGVQLAEALRHRGLVDRAQRRRRAIELLEQVGMTEPERRLRQYPHELSGGMCQRVMIAIALAGEPSLLIADEPTTALDVTIQAQILDLLADLVTTFGMGLLLVSHDMGVIAETCARVCVMYGGRIVEEGPVSTVLSTPRHPYTEALLRSVPTVDGPRRRLPSIAGWVPAAEHMPSGCRFHPRCPLAENRCAEQTPPLVAAGNVRLACWVRGDADA